MDEKERVEDWLEFLLSITLEDRSEFLLSITLIVGMIFLITSHISLNKKTADLPRLSDEFPYYDEVGVLSDEVKNRIHKLNNDYKYDKAQLGIVILKSLKGRNINFVAERIWKTSKLFSRTGQIIIIADDEKIYEIKGYGEMNKTIEDYEIKTIENIMSPYFSEQNYNDGIIYGLDEIESKFYKYSKYKKKKELEEIKRKRSYIFPIPVYLN